VIEHFALLRDHEQALLEMFSKADELSCDLLVTTGGIGPGKYDLVRGAFLASGGEIFLDSLPMRPGKSILFGKIGTTILIALPGPPKAVRTLVDEVVGPILLLLQGKNGCWPEAVHATMLNEVSENRTSVTRYRSGVLSFDSGKCVVRSVGGMEPANCFLLIPPGQKKTITGDKVTVHMCR